MQYYLEELKEAGLTKGQILLVQKLMANYALDACLDSDVRKEAEFLCSVDLHIDGKGYRNRKDSESDGD